MSDLAVTVARFAEKTENNEKRISTHEDLCAERYGEITSSFMRVHERLDRIMIGVIAVLISALGGILMFAATKIFI